MILVIDNYDSFVHTVANYLRELGGTPEVIRNDAALPDEEPEAIVISPGPCTPDEAGVSMQLIAEYSGRVPILGICLGHQCIGQVFGGRVTRAQRPMHGEASLVRHEASGILEGLPDPLSVGRYHSLIVEIEARDSLLAPVAWSSEGEIMALRHRDHPTFGVQFHPEVDPYGTRPPDAPQFSWPRRASMMRVWQDGRIIAPEDAHVAITDRGLLLGDGLFETMAVCRGKVCDLEAHLARLNAGLAIVGFARSVDIPKLRAGIAQYLAAEGALSAVLRVTVTRGTGPRGLAPPEAPHPTILMTLSPMPPKREAPVSLHIATVTRRNEHSPFPASRRCPTSTMCWRCPRPAPRALTTR